MCGKRPVFGARLDRRVVAVVLLAGCAVPAHAADGLWDTVLEKLNVKATPAAPGPDFIERSRPDPAGLGYLPTASPHKVSPLAVKTPDQIQAQKDALDLARQRQLDPKAGKPVPIVKTATGPAAKKRQAAKPAAVAD